MLNISNVQHFSVGDGDGIRTTVFFKGCNLCCPWCHNPENLSAAPVTLHYRTTGLTQTVGRRVTPEELLPELLEDVDFYRESNGGVTLSGGEAMLQADALVELVTLLKQNGVSVLVDTAACVPYSYFLKLNPLVDGYLLDFKTADEQKYRSIGGDLAQVVDNIRRLRRDGMRVVIRIPVIPGFNDDAQSVLAICRQLQQLQIEQVDLLPFHRLGSAKYEAMGLEYAYRDCEPLCGERRKKTEDIYKTYFTVKTER